MGQRQRTLKNLIAAVKDSTGLRKLYESLLDLDDYIKEFIPERRLEDYIDLCELPIFGGDEIEDEYVWSWDKTHILWGKGGLDDWEIAPRK